MTRKSMILEAPLCYTGYGIASMYIYKNLIEKGINVSCFPISSTDTDFFTQEEIDIMISSRETYNPDDPFLKIFHPIELYKRIGRGSYFSFPFFEIDYFDNFETINLRNCDGIITASEWSKNILEEKIKHKNVSVAPLGVDTTIFDHNKYQKQNNNPYIFCNIGKWEVRKGHDILLNIFEQAFSQEDNVELWMMSSAPNVYNPPNEIMKWEAVYKSHKLSDKIKIIPNQQSHEDVAKIISQIDCGIFPSRAEGWNLELLETMSMNKPVITTDFSAHTEFCNKDNSYLVEIDSVTPAHDGKFFRGQGNWANIESKQIDQFVDYMKYVYKNNVRTNKNGVLTGQKFSWSNTSEKIINSVYT